MEPEDVRGKIQTMHTYETRSSLKYICLWHRGALDYCQKKFCWACQTWCLVLIRECAQQTETNAKWTEQHIFQTTTCSNYMFSVNAL